MENLTSRSNKILEEFHQPVNISWCDSTVDQDAKITMQNTWPRKMYFFALASLLSALGVGIITGYSAPATYDMKSRRSRIKPNDDDITWIGSVINFGVIIGGLVAGPLSDKIGRKNTLIFNVVPCCLGWLIICYARSVPEIIIGRILTGISVSLAIVTVAVYNIEISTPDVRGILGTLDQGFLVIGNLLSCAIGYFVTWDQLAIIAAIYSAFAMICLLPICESPQWLLMKGELDSAIAVMNELHGNLVDSKRECNKIHEDLKTQPKGNLSFKEFLHPTIYKPTIICTMIRFIQIFSGTNAVFFYSSIIFDKNKEFLDPKVATIILGAIQVVATIPSNLIVDKTGRKILLIISALLSSVTLMLLGVYYYVSSRDVVFQIKYDWIPLVSLVFNVIAYSIGFGPIPNLLAAELIPIRARSTVSGLMTVVAGMFGFALLKTFGNLEDRFQNYGTFWIYSTIGLLGALYVIFFIPETKGKKLEEIESLFQKQTEDERPLDISIMN